MFPVSLASLKVKLLNCCTKPKSERTCLTVLGVVKFAKMSTLDWATVTPDWEILCPANSTESLMWNLDSDKVILPS